jgi:hypothetical protein
MAVAVLQANPAAPLAAARHLFAAERDLQGAEQWLMDNGKRYSSSCSGIYSIPGKHDHSFVSTHLLPMLASRFWSVFSQQTRSCYACTHTCIVTLHSVHVM